MTVRWIRTGGRYGLGVFNTMCFIHGRLLATGWSGVKRPRGGDDLHDEMHSASCLVDGDLRALETKDGILDKDGNECGPGQTSCSREYRG
jgi:hypothetical protein